MFTEQVCFAIALSLFAAQLFFKPQSRLPLASISYAFRALFFPSPFFASAFLFLPSFHKSALIFFSFAYLISAAATLLESPAYLATGEQVVLKMAKYAFDDFV